MAAPAHWEAPLLRDITFSSPLGKGAYGEVYAGRTASGVLVAVKREQVFDGGVSGKFPPELAKRVFREIVISRHLSSPRSGTAHPNMVPLLDVRGPSPLPSPNAFVHLVFAHAGVSLKKLREENKEVLSLDEVRDLAWQLLQAVHYMHQAGFVHRDIKSDNVLLARLSAPEMGGVRTWRLALCDLGLARSMRVEGGGGSGASARPRATSGTANVVSAGNKPWELVTKTGDVGHEHRYDSSKVDVWSAGCVIAELFMLLSVSDCRRRGGCFSPAQAVGQDLSWRQQDQIKMIVMVLGKPADVDMEWLKVNNPSAYAGVEAASAGMQAGSGGGAGGGGAAAGDGSWWPSWLGGGGGDGDGAPSTTPKLSDIVPSAPAEGQNLLRAMWTVIPSARASAREAMEKPFFAELLKKKGYRAEISATDEAAARVGPAEELHSSEFDDHTCKRLTEVAMRGLLDKELQKWRERG